MKKERNLKPKHAIVVVFVISIICALLTKHEPLKYVFSTVAFMMIGIDNTMEYKSDNEKSSLYFSIMFYVCSLSALVFACVSMMID